MIDRRRAARSVALIVAALAVAGTSPSMPPPGPTQPLSSSGSVHLTADHPFAIQPLRFVVGEGQVANLDVGIKLGDAPDEGRLITSLETMDTVASLFHEAPTGLAEAPPRSTWSIACHGQSPCEARYALVVTWADAPPGAEADIPWSIDAIATFTGSAPAGDKPGVVTIATGEDEFPDATVHLDRLSSGLPIRLSEADRYRSWTVKLTRPKLIDKDPGRSIAWPAVTQARLTLDARQVVGDPITFGADGTPEDRRARGRTDPPVHVSVTGANVGSTGAAGGRPIEFDPFLRCDPAKPCEQDLTIDMSWVDGRPETAFDAGWTLDLVALDAAGEAEALDAELIALDPPRIARATASGTFEQPGPADQPQVRFTVEAPGLPVAGDAPLAVPGVAVVKVTATSVGAVPLPADAVISVFVSGHATGVPGVLLKPGETSTFAFDLRGLCRRTNETCAADGTLGAIIYEPRVDSRNPNGMVVRIDWELEAGISTVADGAAVITVAPSPSARP